MPWLLAISNSRRACIRAISFQLATTTGSWTSERSFEPKGIHVDGQVAVGGIFLEGLAARDFERLSASLAPAVQLRALLPPGPASWEGAEVIAGTFRSWFGGATDFELVDATVGEVGGRLHLSWRLRVRPAPSGSATAGTSSNNRPTQTPAR